MPLYGDLWVSDASKESLLAVWEGVIERTGLRVRTGQRVSEIVREATLRASRGRLRVSRARHGARARPPRNAAPTGRPWRGLPTVFYDVAEMSDFAGRRVLVVGGGDSAIESALGSRIRPARR